MLLSIWLACTPSPLLDAKPAGADAPIAAPAAPSPVPPAPVDPPATLTPMELYAQCRDRVELPEAAGECTVDADCAAMGCGGEVCVSAKTTGMMWTCEDKPCFEVLDACGCINGRCDWTIKGAMPPERRIIKKAPTE